ncbi:Nitrogen regulation protein NR(I) [Polystyrenella longa]|uniref:Nitrogen regulation protein NR(I) n=1 Tax=Polystyrenella longa TaxID=2528007 RepID=A0A518CHZ2_9PLAN|nr:sigma-54 dependent transcriptional regulator [Polystyrenella longa]QDU78848.1 Nitrogen regulation protein NR(I) [Polystyrenella longa]
MNNQPVILIVEDEEIIRTTMAEFLTGEGYQVVEAGTCNEAVRQAASHHINVAICDVQLPDGDGIDLMRRLQQYNPDTLVLIITAYATVENAVEAFKRGAFDYLVKPVLFEDLVHKLERLFQYRNLYLENQNLRRELSRRDKIEEIVGSSKALLDVQETLRKAAVTNSNVLLVGESGSGKELFARSMHAMGPKKEEKFVPFNCSIRPVETLEAQLFGAKAGTATGAQTDVAGILETIGEGTIFLSEITQLPLATQSQLLRAIEYKEITPLGGTKTIPFHARIIAATTKDLEKEVKEGTLQEDLFYRFDGCKIIIPPLRERLDDVPELVEHFITKHSLAMGKRVNGASSETIRMLMSAQWRGNVRQLDNAVERAVMMCEGMQIEVNDLPPDLLGINQPLPDTDDLRSALRHYEKLHIARVLRQCPDKREAAKRLKLGLSSLYRKIEELGVEI